MKVTLIGDPDVSPEALEDMRAFHAEHEGMKWMVYQNHDLGDRAGIGTLRFLACGPGCTFATPPNRYPDTQFGTGWRHVLVGHADLSTGKVVPKEMSA